MNYNNIIKALEPLISRVRLDVTALKKKGKSQFWTDEPLTDDLLSKHLNGVQELRGVCPIKAGESTTRCAVIDMDSHKGELPWEDMLAKANALYEHLADNGIYTTMFRSSGGNGIHLIALWDKPQDAASVRTRIRELIGELGYIDKAGGRGVLDNQVEVFPKQDSVPLGSYGNQFILPLGGNSRFIDPVFGLMDDNEEAASEIVWEMSDPVVAVDRPKKKDEGELIELIEAQPLDLTRDQIIDVMKRVDVSTTGYDEWMRIGAALHHQFEGSDEGLKLFDAWSSKDTRPNMYSKKSVKDKWKSFGKYTGKPITMASMLHQYGPPVVVNNANPTAGMPKNKDGKIITSYTAMAQVVTAMQIVSFDDFIESPMIRRGDKWDRFDDMMDYVFIAKELERKGFSNLSLQKVKEVVKSVMMENRFDSAINWINGLVWDGVDRCTHLFHRYFAVEKSDYEKAVSLYFTSAMAGRCLTPGEKCDMVPILYGEQGLGKTEGIKALAPIPSTFTEINLGHHNDADLARQLRGKLIGELGELRGLKTKESEAIKAWITRTHEEWVPKYSETSRIMGRRSVFVGSTNDSQPLVDKTGNRRWLPMYSGECDIQQLKADINQIWAQAAEIYKSNGVMWKDAYSLAPDNQSEFLDHDEVMVATVKELLETDFLGHDKLRMTDICKIVYSDKVVTRLDQFRVADALRFLGFESHHTREGKRWVRKNP